MATPETFGNRMHFDGDGCDDDSIRHRMGMQETKLRGQVFATPIMGRCTVLVNPMGFAGDAFPCGRPVMEEEFDCGNHTTNGSE